MLGELAWLSSFLGFWDRSCVAFGWTGPKCSSEHFSTEIAILISRGESVCCLQHPKDITIIISLSVKLLSKFRGLISVTNANCRLHSASFLFVQNNDWCLCFFCPQTNPLCHVCPDTDRDAGVLLYSWPGSPLAGFYYCWNFRVGSHPAETQRQKNNIMLISYFGPRYQLIIVSLFSFSRQLLYVWLSTSGIWVWDRAHLSRTWGNLIWDA